MPWWSSPRVRVVVVVAGAVVVVVAAGAVVVVAAGAVVVVVAPGDHVPRLPVVSLPSDRHCDHVLVAFHCHEPAVTLVTE